MMTIPVTRFDVARRERAPAAAAAAAAATKFPRRPDAGVLNETIPLFYIGRNKNGLWVVREEQGRTGGIFLFRRSALRFVAEYGERVGCATMFLDEPFELEVDNRRGSLARGLAGFIAAAMAAVRKLVAGDGRRRQRRLA